VKTFEVPQPPPPSPSSDDDVMEIEEEEDFEPSTAVSLHIGPSRSTSKKGPRVLYTAPVPNSNYFFGCGTR